jgi:ATP-dependent Zn protease
MNAEGVNWVRLLINWLPMLLIIGVWVFFVGQARRPNGFWGSQKRAADALERIAAALEKRSL